MISLFVHAFCCFGICWIVGHAHVSWGLRLWLSRRSKFLVEGLECCGCVSFHLGWIAWLLRLTPAELHTWWQSALFTATSSLVLARLSGLVNEYD